MTTKNWFIEKGLRVLDYQQKAIVDVQESINKREVTILAACPSAGKTLMTINIIENYLKKNPLNKILVLTHGTTILRTQFHDVLNEVKPDFTYNLVEKFNEYNNSKQVNVCLPQTLKSKKLNSVDLLIVDEAHHFYFGEIMVKEIIEKTKPKKQLLLTGTPSPFIFRNMPIIPVALNTIFEEDMIGNVYIEIATSCYNFSTHDYNRDDELKNEVEIKQVDTKKTLDDLVNKIVEKLKSIRGNEYINLIPEWLPTLKRLQKTMIACRSQKQAMQVKEYFDKIDIKSSLSISNIDYDSVEIENFKNDIDCLMLIVVNRGILGFNYPELVNVVDMTTSQNIDRIFQLFCRVIRKHPMDERKLFFKVAPNTLSDWYKYIMTGVVALSNEYYYTHFNGKNFNDMKIPVRKNTNIPNILNDDNIELIKPRTRRKVQNKGISPIDFSGLPVFELFTNIYHKKDSLLHVYAFTTVRNVRAEFMKCTPFGYWTKEICMENAQKYQRLTDWRKKEWNVYCTAHRHGWLEDCTAHMIKQIHQTRTYWTKEMCIESALPYEKYTDWNRNCPREYKFAHQRGWMNECTEHMKKPYVNMFDEFDENIEYPYEPELETFNQFEQLIDTVIKKIETKINGKNPIMKRNEVIVGNAIINVLKNWNILFMENTPEVKYDKGKRIPNKFAKNKILLFLKEQTGLSTREIRIAIKPFKVMYFIEKMDYIKN
jgi:superfamily II DNA or RNA helicase